MMDKTAIAEKKVQLSQMEIKNYFEMLNKYIGANGIDATLTYAALKTLKSLEKDYNEILQGIYNPDNDPKFAEYKQKVNENVVKFADRDEQGELILDKNKNPVITEQIVEYQNEIKKLQEEYAETLKLVNGANDFNRNYLSQAREVTIWTWRRMEEVPDEIPGVFMLYMFKNEI
jgi:hypothetical protein